MRKLYFSFLTLCIAVGCSAQHKPANNREIHFSLNDFYSENTHLDAEVEAIFNRLTQKERVAQMIISSLGKLGKSNLEVTKLIQNKKIGGVIFLSGQPEKFEITIDSLTKLNQNWPLLMSMDAEPSLFNRRLLGTPYLPKTADLKTEIQVANAVTIIDSTLTKIGFRQNFAPVIDLSAENEAIGNRTFGSDSATVVPMAISFIHQTQKDQIVATAKHFPGHGRVSGDTHKKLVYIDGEMTEVNLYKPIIEAGVLSIMVGHIAIENNKNYSTNGLPSTLSKKVVTELLRNELGFNGIIITDAMNMGAVSTIPQCGVKAALAGCDMILMPIDEIGTLEGIIAEMQSNPDVEEQIYTSAKRIIRLKLCLGMQF